MRLGINKESLDGIAVLLLPADVDDGGTIDGLKDTDDGVLLAKHFRSVGVSVKTAFDLGVQTKVLERRGGDIWLGTLWILENLTAPTIVGILSAWLTTKCGVGAPSNSATDSPTVHIDLKLQSGERVSSLKFKGSADDFIQVLSGLRKRGQELRE